MKRWPSGDMSYIYNNAHVFLTEDISQDDPFLLYATLYSGLGTCFVSQDLMRGHKFLLADPKLQATFIKWQAKHQFCISYIDMYGNVGLQKKDKPALSPSLLSRLARTFDSYGTNPTNSNTHLLQ
ncbi:hypothetical protein J6590_035744 [Homalodisca vitripennis]|nr:hypothetical protein J6590_035744 [Homalodisca vitripennis]